VVPDTGVFVGAPGTGVLLAEDAGVFVGWAAAEVFVGAGGVFVGACAACTTIVPLIAWPCTPQM
jgi:hypothetical protein